MTFQKSGLFDSMPVWKNVAFQLLQGRQISAAKAKERAIDKLAAVGLDALPVRGVALEVHVLPVAEHGVSAPLLRLLPQSPARLHRGGVLLRAEQVVGGGLLHRRRDAGELAAHAEVVAGARRPRLRRAERAAPRRLWPSWPGLHERGWLGGRKGGGGAGQGGSD